jgi:hypothetical protein
VVVTWLSASAKAKILIRTPPRFQTATFSSHECRRRDDLGAARVHQARKSLHRAVSALIEAVPYTIHIVLTDNGIQFGDMMVAVSAVAHIATGAFWR